MNCYILDSQRGEDILDFLVKNIPQNSKFDLSELIKLMKNENFIVDDEEFEWKALFDSYLTALAEFYFLFIDNNKFNFPYEKTSIEQKDDWIKFNEIKSFTADEYSLDFFLNCLMKIKNDKRTDTRKKIAEALGDEEIWEDWFNNLNKLIKNLTKEKENLYLENNIFCSCTS